MYDVCIKCAFVRFCVWLWKLRFTVDFTLFWLGCVSKCWGPETHNEHTLYDIIKLYKTSTVYAPVSSFYSFSYMFSVNSHFTSTQWCDELNVRTKNNTRQVEKMMNYHFTNFWSSCIVEWKRPKESCLDFMLRITIFFLSRRW